jgi:hypothetical protein
MGDGTLERRIALVTPIGGRYSLRMHASKTFALLPLLLLAAACGGHGHAHGAHEAHEERREQALENHAEIADFEKLGERVIDGKIDRDRIGVGRADGHFKRVAIVVEESAAEIFDVEITFGDGEVFRVPTRLVFDRNTRSRVIDLPGGERVIRHVDFKYGNLPGGGRAHVELWGK